MKKIILFIVVLFLTSFYYLNIQAADIEFIKGNFTTEEIIPGVEHTHSNSITAGLKQNVNVVIKANDNNQVKVVNWSKFTSTGAWTFGTVEDIARDFESKNPGYSVIAGVNGDYFAYSPSRSINASINANGDIVKAQNHAKYLSVGFTEDDVVINKTMEFRSSYYLTVYEANTNKIVRVVKLIDLNSNTLNNDETTVFYNNTMVNIMGANKYVVRTPMGLSYLDSHLFAKGQISEITNNNLTISDKEFAVVTKDAALQQLLSQKPIVRVQKLVSGNLLNTSSVIGVDSQILKDGVVRSFTEIGGQSDSNNQSRHPRTSLGITEDGSIILATVDGRQATGDAGVYSYGVDLRELATIMKAYGAKQAFNLDGGGSTQMIVKNENGQFVTVNSPSEGPHFPEGHTYYKTSYRSDANALLFVVPDINVNVNYHDLTSSSLQMDYSITPNSTIQIQQSKLIVNGQVQPINEQSGQLTLTNLIENGINVVNFEFDYQKDGQSVTRVFESRIIDLSADSGNRQQEQPSNFSVEFIDLENTSNFKVKVCYVDRDHALTKVTVFLKDVNLNISANPDGDFCHSAIILNAKVNTTYDFGVKYYVYGQTDPIVLEPTYSYKYKPIIEEPVKTSTDVTTTHETTQETTQTTTSTGEITSTGNITDETKEEESNNPLIMIIGGIVLLSAAGSIFYFIKRKI